MKSACKGTQATAAYIFLVDVVSVATIWATAQYVERRLLHIFYLIHHQSIKVHALNMYDFYQPFLKSPQADIILYLIILALQ